MGGNRAAAPIVEWGYFLFLGSGPVGDDDLWCHHREIFFSEPAERKLQHWVSLGASWEGFRASREGLRVS